MKELLEKYEEIIYNNATEFLKEFLVEYNISEDYLIAVYFGSGYTEVKFLVSSGETCVDYVRTSELLEWCEQYENTNS